MTTTEYNDGLPWNVAITETVDGTYMILVGGFQWGPDSSRVDSSGANDATYPTVTDAVNAYMEDNRS